MSEYRKNHFLTEFNCLKKKIKELLLYVNEIMLEGISVVKSTWCIFSHIQVDII